MYKSTAQISRWLLLTPPSGGDAENAAREELRAPHARLAALPFSAPRSTRATCPQARGPIASNAVVAFAQWASTSQPARPRENCVATDWYRGTPCQLISPWPSPLLARSRKRLPTIPNQAIRRPKSLPAARLRSRFAPRPNLDLERHR
jgi:hypothetical protein